MKVELMNIVGKGRCIVISEIDPDIFREKKDPQYIVTFSNIHLIADLIRNDMKIAAIKEVRAQTGWGLKESKIFMDGYMPNDRLFSTSHAADKFIADNTFCNFFKDNEFKI